MKQVDSVPGSKHGEIRLRFKRPHRENARKLGAFLQHRLRELESEPYDEKTDEATAEY